jgi:hypothetical protein
MKIRVNKISVPTALSITLILVICGLLFLTYQYWYSNLKPAKVQAKSSRIVSVDMTGYRNVISLLDQMLYFVPDDRASSQGNPFIYR